MKNEGVVAGAVSLVWALVVAVAAYAILRSTQFFTHPGPNPSAVSWSTHTGYYWRIWTASYMGGIAAFVVLLLTRGGVEAPSRALVRAVGVAAALLTLQAALFP